ncbi:MAG: hypothetical protein M1830_000087 [Pleopsidium flavum]|nr:MAG: hypothetical protein M1830_000087 [Pleopsidium flavum]
MTTDFNWQSGNLDRRRFTALTPLLRLSGEQQEQLPSVEDDCHEAILTDADTEKPATIADSGNDALKQRFLDRLAKILFAMQSAAIVIARNESEATIEDERFKANLEAWMTRVSHDTQPSLDNFYHDLSSYNQSRYDEKYIPDFEEHIRQCEPFWASSAGVTWDRALPLWNGITFTDTEEIGEYSQTTHKDYMVFAAWKIGSLIKTAMQQLSLAERHCHLSTKAYEIRHMQSVQIFLQASMNEVTAQNILHDMYFLGRTRAAYMTFKEVASRLPNFGSTTLQFLQPQKASKPFSDRHMSFEQALGYAGMGNGQDTLRDHFSIKHSPSRLSGRFQLILPRCLHVHAEMQILTHFLQGASNRREPFPYIGVSKKTCFLCGAFLSAYGQVGTRACHVKVYPKWTIPVIGSLAADQVDRLVSALSTGEARVLELLHKPLTPVRAAVPESSAGFTVLNESCSYLRKSALAESHRSEHTARWIERLAKCLDGETTTPGEPSRQKTDPETDGSKPTPVAARTPPSSGSCDECERETSTKCSGCLNVWYCNQDCQRKGWQGHIFYCSPKRPLDSADWLWRACIEDKFPDDEQTCEDFGFSKLSTGGEQSNLFGLYIGLFKVLDVSTRTVHAWQMHNNLAEGIKEVFVNRLPANNRGAYFAWFLQNQHVVNQSLPEPVVHVKDIIGLRAWRHIGGSTLETSAQIQEIVHKWPDAKRECFVFYCLILSEWNPSPDTEMWILFAFCVCNQYTEPREGRLGDLYKILATRATFDEFCTAFDNSKLINLFDQKGLNKERQHFPHLEHFLAGSPRVFRSVWYLKQFVFTEAKYPANSVKVDYGLANCDTARERLELKQLYKRFFDGGGDGLELDGACIAGKIFEFLKSTMGVDQELKKLLKNPYPLARV